MTDLRVVPTDSRNSSQHRNVIATATNELLKVRPPNDRTQTEVSLGITTVDTRYPAYHAKRYFAKLDGTTDDSVAFNTAITVANAAGGGSVIFDGPTNILNVALKDKVSLIGIGNPSVAVNPSSATDVAISAIGTVGTTISLTANAAKGAYTVTVASAAGLAVGNRVIIRDDTWVVASTDGRNQEINRIVGISGGTITLQKGLIGSYATASTAEICLLNAVADFRLQGFTVNVASGSNGGGFDLRYCSDFTIEDVDTNAPASWPGFRLLTCANFRIIESGAQNGQGSVSGGSSGLSMDFNNCHHGHVSKLNVRNYNQIEFAMRTRFIDFVDNICAHSVDACVNTHGNSNSHIKIARNTFDSPELYAVAVGNSTAKTFDEWITVEDNECVNCGAHAISVASKSGGTNNNNITIRNNRCRVWKLTQAGSPFAAIHAELTDDLTVEGNDIDGTTASSNIPDVGIDVSNCARPRILSNRVREIGNGYGVQMTSCSDYTVDLNYFDNISSNNIITASSAGNCYIRNNFSDDVTVSIETAIYQAGNTWNYGTFTATATGLTTSPTDTVSFERVGWSVRLNLRGGASGTSNSTALTFTGLPADLFPARQQRVHAISVTDNSVVVLGRVTIAAAGTVTFGTSFNSDTFTNANTKGWNIATFWYALD